MEALEDIKEFDKAKLTNEETIPLREAINMRIKIMPKYQVIITKTVQKQIEKTFTTN